MQASPAKQTAPSYFDSAAEWAAANPKDAELAMATAIVVIANILAQAIEKFRKQGASWFAWDIFACIRMAAWTISSVPVVSTWLGLLASTFGEGTDVLTVASKLVLDQFLFSPALLCVFLIFCGIFDSMIKQKDEVSAALSKIRNDLFKMQRAGWAVWIPVAILNFTVVPAHLKIIFLNAVGLFWNIGFALMLSGMEDGGTEASKLKAA